MGCKGSALLSEGMCLTYAGVWSANERASLEKNQEGRAAKR